LQVLALLLVALAISADAAATKKTTKTDKAAAVKNAKREGNRKKLKFYFKFTLNSGVNHPGCFHYKFFKDIQIRNLFEFIELCEQIIPSKWEFMTYFYSGSTDCKRQHSIHFLRTTDLHPWQTHHRRRSFAWRHQERSQQDQRSDHRHVQQLSKPQLLWLHPRRLRRFERRPG